jgi:hypothetical protein
VIKKDDTYIWSKMKETYWGLQLFQKYIQNNYIIRYNLQDKPQRVKQILLIVKALDICVIQRSLKEEKSLKKTMEKRVN